MTDIGFAEKRFFGFWFESEAAVNQKGFGVVKGLTETGVEIFRFEVCNRTLKVMVSSEGGSKSPSANKRGGSGKKPEKNCTSVGEMLDDGVNYLGVEITASGKLNVS